MPWGSAKKDWLIIIWSLWWVLGDLARENVESF
jgi:hypothetical protein